MTVCHRKNTILLLWTSSIKYLGINNLSGPRFKVDIDSITRFYGSCSTIMKCSVTQSELLRLSLMESYSLPVLQYCIRVINLNESQLNVLNICWNTTYQRRFGCHYSESVRELICGLGRLDFRHIHALALSVSKNVVVNMMHKVAVCTVQLTACFVSRWKILVFMHLRLVWLNISNC